MAFFVGRGGTAALYFTLLLMLGACGQNNWVKDVKMSLATESGMVYSEAEVYLDTKGVPLTPIQLPILVPGRDVAIGELIVQAYLGSEIEANYLMTILLNLSEVAQIPTGVSPILPNGQALPVAGIDEGAIVALPVGGNGSRLYFSLDLNARRMMLGTAVVVNSLDNPLGDAASAFLPVPLDTGVRAWFGMFFGNRPRTNGFGVFIDAQQVLEESDREMQLLATQSRTLQTQSMSRSRVSTMDEDWEIIIDPLSQKDQLKVDRHLYQIHKRKVPLRLQ